MTTRPQTMRDAFISALIPIMSRRDDIFFVAGDLGAPALDELRAMHQDRFINVGIAEQNLVNVAVGLALEGNTVYGFAIAPFITMRCYEQIRINLALLSQVRSLNVTLIGVGAGASYDLSGPSHQTFEDLSIMRTLPNIQVLSPADAATARALLDHTLASPGPKYLRFDSKPLPPVYPDAAAVPVADGFCELTAGRDLCLVTTGYMTGRMAHLISSNGLAAGQIDLFNLTAFRADALADALRKYRAVVTVEEGFIGRGGLDAVILNLLAAQCIHADFKSFGYTDRYFFECGDRDYLRAQAGFGDAQILETCRSLLASTHRD